MKSGRTLVFVALFLASLTHAARCDHLYTDTGCSALTGYWAGDGGGALFLDNPATVCRCGAAGALYCEKYGFAALPVSVAYVQIKTGGIVAGFFADFRGTGAWRERDYGVYFSGRAAGLVNWGMALKLYTTETETDRKTAPSYDFGISCKAGPFALHAAVKDANHPVLTDEVAHTLICGLSYFTGDIGLSLKHVDLYRGYSYNVPAMHYFYSENLRFSYAVNTGNDEHRFAIGLSRGMFTLGLGYVIPPVLAHYAVAEAGVRF